MNAEEVTAYSRERIAELRSVGIGFVEYLAAGRGDCAACRELAKRKKIPIAEAIELPPPDCRCKFGCRLCVIAVT